MRGLLLLVLVVVQMQHTGVTLAAPCVTGTGMVTKAAMAAAAAATDLVAAATLGVVGAQVGASLRLLRLPMQMTSWAGETATGSSSSGRQEVQEAGVGTRWVPLRSSSMWQMG